MKPAKIVAPRQGPSIKRLIPPASTMELIEKILAQNQAILEMNAELLLSLHRTAMIVNEEKINLDLLKED